MQTIDVSAFSMAQRRSLLEWLEERAAIMEFDGGLSRPEAEKQATQLFLAKLRVNPIHKESAVNQTNTERGAKQPHPTEPPIMPYHVWDKLSLRGEKGLTAEALAFTLQQPLSAVLPRLHELKVAGYVVETEGAWITTQKAWK
jgi:predicted Rossmann fold nucleotide-binding protein DprA/Smf involved in DNA uptake